ncbi:glycosyltransferase family 2 protein [Photobacterium sp. WH24]|uniref:glycosyltransferase family 2 protein n=1 Tax=Photobacterium sp. WH24 TaxID=2827237 RepID=UPI001C484BF0|nr:glycosyltransferase family 2 protein [Photobacterium sp. WH24]MBV7260598.1 glycosyltransferase family 2 protein [Photobacterium sp. WH24]
MTVYLSVVSHGHGELISQIDVLSKINHAYKVVVKNNKQDIVLIDYLKSKNIEFIDSDYFLGFGENNNLVFSFCLKKLGMNADDIFIVLNPDVDVDISQIEMLVNEMKKNGDSCVAINLYKSFENNISDNSIRQFPSLMTFASSFLGLGNGTIIDKSLIDHPCKVDWAAGSFLAFNASHYNKLKGFDEGYFMYCEDVDICFRSKLSGTPVKYYPHVKALHLARHANRRIFSKHFYWHLKSALRFILTKYGLTSNKSSLID